MTDITVTLSGKENSEHHQPGEIYTRQFVATIKMIDGVPTIESLPLWAHDTIIHEYCVQISAYKVLVTQAIKAGAAGVITIGINDEPA